MSYMLGVETLVGYVSIYNTYGMSAARYICVCVYL